MITEKELMQLIREMSPEYQEKQPRPQTQPIDDVTLDTCQTLYRQKGLYEAQQRHLIDNGYIHIIKGPTLHTGTANYYVRDKPKNQGNNHFILTRLIAEAAENMGLNHKINDYGHDFDVSVMRHDGKTIGFEVETGTNNQRDIIEKTKRLDKACTTRAKDWYFVVPSKQRKKYKSHHQTILRGKVHSTLTELSETEPNQKNLYRHLHRSAIPGKNI